MKAFVYFNLHRKLWSIKALEGPDRGRVVARVAHVAMFDCTFQVSEAGRQRVLSTGRKNVHAGIVGTVAHTDSLEPVLCDWGTPVSYNPRTGPTFYAKDSGAPVQWAEYAELNASRREVRALEVQ